MKAIVVAAITNKILESVIYVVSMTDLVIAGHRNNGLAVNPGKLTKARLKKLNCMQSLKIMCMYINTRI